MKLYKLTDKHKKTRNYTTWGPNVSNELSGEGKELCSPDVIHAYKHPLLASFLKPIHCPEYTKLWEAEGDVVVDDGTKVGVKKLTTLKEVKLPEITTEQRIKIGILCVKEVYKDKKWNKWADKWLSGEDRSKDSAYVAARAARAAYVAARAARATYAAADAAAYATYAAADAAAYAAYADAAAAAAYADAAARDAAYAARDVIAARAAADNLLDILSIIEKVINETV